MTLPADLSEDKLRRLRAAMEADDPPMPAAQPVAAPESATPATVRAKAMAKQLTKRVIRRALSWYVDEAARVSAEHAVEVAFNRVTADLPRPQTKEDPRVIAINQEMMKGEFRSMLATLDDLGQAIAPAAGLEGASVRMAELRERLNELDRRTRGLRAAATPNANGADRETADAGEPTPVGTVSRFDYAGFEQRFRGDSTAITASQSERYLELLRDHAPVMDIGCGRGELVGALAGEGIAAFGVDLDADAVAEATSMGRDVRLADALQTLRAAEPRSLGAIVSFHLLEHLELEPLLELLELAVERLRPGGVFIAETPNPASLIVLGNSYILDPTHVRPLHPSLLVFLCERAGFRNIELRFFAPASAYQLPLVSGDDLPPWVSQINTALTRLNDVLFGPQEYAVIATAPKE